MTTAEPNHKLLQRKAGKAYARWLINPAEKTAMYELAAVVGDDIIRECIETERNEIENIDREEIEMSIACDGCGKLMDVKDECGPVVVLIGKDEIEEFKDTKPQHPGIENLCVTCGPVYKEWRANGCKIPKPRKVKISTDEPPPDSVGSLELGKQEPEPEPQSD